MELLNLNLEVNEKCRHDFLTSNFFFEFFELGTDFFLTLKYYEERGVRMREIACAFERKRERKVGKRERYDRWYCVCGSRTKKGEREIAKR